MSVMNIVRRYLMRVCGVLRRNPTVQPEEGVWGPQEEPHYAAWGGCVGSSGGTPLCSLRGVCGVLRRNPTMQPAAGTGTIIFIWCASTPWMTWTDAAPRSINITRLRHTRTHARTVHPYTHEYLMSSVMQSDLIDFTQISSAYCLLLRSRLNARYFVFLSIFHLFTACCSDSFFWTKTRNVILAFIMTSTISNFTTA